MTGLLRGLSGVLAGGLVVLALALGLAWVVATRVGSPGPAPWLLAWHALAAVAAVVLQVRADRAGPAAAVGVLAISAAVLGVLWLA
ncbi:hypothetical protein [Pseudonocardia sp.]|uniref:hypothetical protein n=1 Tax=Pseudonocardia sp. TaxID=60912 RepID=UPI0026107FE5|nr:hypothetical protein [Pseudonocardia sp.]